MKLFSTFVFFAVVAGVSAQSLSSSVDVRSGGSGGGDTISDSSLLTRTDTIGPFGGTATAQSNYGELHASAFGFNAGGTDFSYVQGYATFEDMITIAGTESGPQYIWFTYEVSGDSTGTGDGTRNANLLFDGLPNGVPGGLTSGTDMRVESAFATEFFFNVPFNIRTELFATLTFPFGGTGTHDVDFANTAELVEIVVRDAAGNIVDGLSISSASGTVYPNPVPEPASMMVVGTGLIALARRRRIN